MAAEAFGLFSLVLHLFSVWALVERRPPPPRKDVAADIFVTTWNEPVEMLRNTLLAAKQVRLARHIWLLDDGARPEMHALADSLGVKYLSRTDRSNAKAGNLNNALKHTDAEFIAQFDCDHAPAPDFFERTLGYFEDPKTAFVQTPQDFYNIDSFQHRRNRQSTEFWHEQTLFYRVIQPGKDRWNAAFFCGCCAVVRTAALADIGGFATGTITEDIHTSLKLHKKGWRSVYHSQSLAFGVAPANLDQYDTQRLRWGRGAMQVWRREGIIFTSGLTLAQRICYFASVSTYFEGWQKAILYFMPMVVLVTGSMPIIWTGERFLDLFLLWLLSGMLVNETVGRGYTKTVWMEEYNCLRFFTFMNATLALIIPIKWRFRVTPKDLTSIGRIGLRYAPQLLIIAAALVGFSVGTVQFFSHHYLPMGAYVANAVWTAINAIIAARAIQFSIGKSRQRREGHRFAIPVPVITDLKDASSSIIADDLSEGGMRLHVEKGLDVPEVVTGKMVLPNGAVSFSGDVVRVNDVILTDERVVHVHFNWKDGKSPDHLNECLFGNALQWAANDWRETSVRDFTWRHFVAWLRRTRIGAPDEDWRFCLLGGDGPERVRCLVQKSRDEEGAWRVLSYERPPSVNNLTLNIRDLNKTESRLHVHGAQAFSVGGGTVFIIVLKRGEAAGVSQGWAVPGAIAYEGGSA
ncbi:MAG: glycosyltransferase [Parvularculaceae bacterium]